MIPRSSRRPWRNRASFSGVFGSSGPFTEHAALPTNLAGEKVSGRPKKPATKRKKQTPGRIDDEAAREAALEYERAERQRGSERRKVEARREKERQPPADFSNCLRCQCLRP
jgi:hypothetical protein